MPKKRFSACEMKSRAKPGNFHVKPRNFVIKPTNFPVKPGNFFYPILLWQETLKVFTVNQGQNLQGIPVYGDVCWQRKPLGSDFLGNLEPSKGKKERPGLGQTVLRAARAGRYDHPSGGMGSSGWASFQRATISASLLPMFSAFNHLPHPRWFVLFTGLTKNKTLKVFLPDLRLVRPDIRARNSADNGGNL